METQCQGSRGESPGEDEGQERIGLRVRVTLHTLGTDLAVAQNPGVQFGCCLGLSVLSLLAAVRAAQVGDSGTSESQTFGSVDDGVFGPEKGECFGALLIRWSAAVEAECFGI